MQRDATIGCGSEPIDWISWDRPASGCAPKPCILVSTLTINQWNLIYKSPDYRRMIAQKTRFVVAATAFFVIFYFALPVLVGYWPELMERQVWGVVNWAYLFAFSQFLMAWALAYLYLRIARRFDQMSEKILAERTIATEAADGQRDE